MKKLSKLSINPDKVIKNHELVNLRGGYHEWETGTCAATINIGGQDFCSDGLSRASAIEWAQCSDIENGTGCVGNWCCTSCSSASWYPCS